MLLNRSPAYMGQLAAERLQKVARGESEANTPGKSRAWDLCRVSGTGSIEATSSAADAARPLSQFGTRGVRFALTPRYLLLPLRGNGMPAKTALRRRLRFLRRD